ncbi:hypothetical protein AC579_2539 [Pseudocercospora musae]|uniref:Uncharacterized protein n=1 Tax=Pseudocercospora musae TaxID=113226 RepID=A0A139I2Y2_9PEZI|nr:hypothetical protein AC579_2539 [Pseudocercospora musae]
MSYKSGAHKGQQQWPSAAQRTFAIPELLECILLHVAIHHADTSCACSEFTRLFPLQRTSRRFYHTIAGSRALLHLMLLKPINIRKERLLGASLGRLQWFYNEFLSTPLDTKGPRGHPSGSSGSRDHHSIRLHKFISHDIGDAHLEHPSLGLLREKNSTNASWRKIHVGLGDDHVPIRVRLRVILYPRGCTTTHLRRMIGPIVRYTIYWKIAETDTLGTLFDRYLDVLSRSLEEHTAAGETYRLLRESKRYYKRIEAEPAP